MKRWQADISNPSVGHWIAYVYDETGNHQIQTRAFVNRRMAVESAIRQAHDMGAYIETFSVARER